ncbi:hypothetical protein Nepgr_028897 [Nepenthes gracilis]|uniref:Uncharacterized protein n=1 Tax=Nepenthes gracilis TaxID=150966 RepID=A0AAD3TD27_NEPGR|nr:hypothetical protein Nepgr_028897 [Nepenthes gracilis]
MAPQEDEMDEGLQAQIKRITAALMFRRQMTASQEKSTAGLRITSSQPHQWDALHPPASPLQIRMSNVPIPSSISPSLPTTTSLSRLLAEILTNPGFVYVEICFPFSEFCD